MASRWKKVLWGVGSFAVFFGVIGALYGRQIVMILMFMQADKPPATPFAATPQPPAPDYGSPASWAALPDLKDDADVVPAMDSTDAQATAPVDVFFVHPTTYFTNKTWNAPLDDEFSRTLIDQDILRNQAGAFNGCCRVYAPRYRQIAFGAQKGAPAEEAAKGWDLAYTDVRAAFEYYLSHHNNGRPFILASHSQGTVHAVHLMQDFITGKPLKEKLVAAYLVGIPLPTDLFTRTLTDVPLCTSAEQTAPSEASASLGPKSGRTEQPAVVSAHPYSLSERSQHSTRAPAGGRS